MQFERDVADAINSMNGRLLELEGQVLALKYLASFTAIALNKTGSLTKEVHNDIIEKIKSGIPIDGLDEPTAKMLGAVRATLDTIARNDKPVFKPVVIDGGRLGK